MLKEIKTIFRVTADLKRQSVSMRRKLMFYWCVMISMAVGLFMFLLSIAGGFSDQRQKLQENLNLHLEHTNSELSQHLDHLMAQSITLSEQISYEIEKMFVVNGKSVSDLNDSPELLLELQDSLYEKLYAILMTSECSGAYFVLDVTTNTQAKTSENSRSGMYLRFANLNTKNSATQDIVYFRGIPDIAREERIELHNRWNLEFDKSAFPEYDQLIERQVDDLTRTSYWTECFRLTDTWEDVMLLAVPILDNNGAVIGLCGVEISELYFYLSYPVITSPFGSMTTVLAPTGTKGIELAQGIIAASDDTYMDSFTDLQIKTNKSYNVYETQNETYLGKHEKLMINTASDRSMSVAALIKKQSYDDALHLHQYKMMTVFLVFFLFMFVLSVIMTNRFVKPIAVSLQAIQQDTISEENKTGISEIDMLMNFLKTKQANRAVQESDLPPNIAELFRTFLERVDTLTASEKKILNFYIEGLDAAEITEKAFLSMSTVRKHSGNIYRKLNISSRDELMLYVDLFRRCDQLEELLKQSKSPL